MLRAIGGRCDPGGEKEGLGGKVQGGFVFGAHSSLLLAAGKGVLGSKKDVWWKASSWEVWDPQAA